MANVSVWQDGKVVEVDEASLDLLVTNPDAPPPVPSEVSRAQAKIALLRAGLLDATEQQVTAAGGETAIWYADALNWRRDNDHVISIGAALNLTPAQIDDLFRQAAQIEA